MLVTCCLQREKINSKMKVACGRVVADVILESDVWESSSIVRAVLVLTQPFVLTLFYF